MAQLKPSVVVDSNTRTLAAVGELRSGQFEILDGERAGLDVLVSVPGHSPLPRIAVSAGLYRRPAMALPKRLARELQAHFLDELASDIDSLPKGSLWGERLLAWAQALRTDQTRVHYWDETPIYTRLIARQDRSLVLPDPIHADPMARSNEIRLNVEGDEHLRIRAWFMDLFNRSADISSDVRACIEASWA